MCTKRIRSAAKVPWINKDIKDAMNLRNYYKKKKCCTEYKMCRNKCVNLIRTAKGDHHSTVIHLAEG